MKTNLLLIALFFAAVACGAEGTVTYRIGSCDYFVVQSSTGYAVLEWYGGYDPDKGDSVVGGFTSYGMKTVYDTTADEEIKVWVEDYYLSRPKALEILTEHCE